MILGWARVTGVPWPSLGFAVPKNWPRTIIIGILAGVLLKLAMKAVIMPLLGAPPINEHYSWLTGNARALPGMLFTVIVSAGFAEEVVWRGFLFNRSERLFGTGKLKLVATIVITSALFAAAHYADQRVPGVQQAFIVGLAYGTMYATTRSLALPMITHTVFDLTAVALIYWGWESTVAGWLF